MRGWDEDAAPILCLTVVVPTFAQEFVTEDATLAAVGDDDDSDGERDVSVGSVHVTQGAR